MVVLSMGYLYHFLLVLCLLQDGRYSEPGDGQAADGRAAETV